MKKSTRYEMRDTRYENGSALILAVVLTSLLAIVGMMFVMTARVDRIATSAISENKELNSAVETVIARISQELVLDVPGVTATNLDYYDYPGQYDEWLASLEPYEYSLNNYRWRQISDVYDRLGANLELDAEIIPDYQDSSEVDEGELADADGDGVADSRWIELDDITSGKGRPIYAAIRIIDNGGMLNVNTIYANMGGDDERKGDMLTDIYIDGLVKSGADLITTFLDNRSDAPDANTYHREAARRIENPDTTTGHFYTLYDISEELSLRNRYVLYPGESSMTRLESPGPPRCLKTTLRATIYGNAYAPYTDSDFDAWKRRLNPFDIGAFGNEPNSNNYDFRHLLTTYNFDRIINPVGVLLNNGKMVNVNIAGENLIYSTIRTALIDADPNSSDANEIAAQIAVNLKDFRDGRYSADYDPNDNVTTINVDGTTYYGFEQPCIYISELAHKFILEPGGISPEPEPPIRRSYAIELHKPYPQDNDPNGWRLLVDNNPVEDPIDWTTGSNQYHVILFEDPGMPLDEELRQEVDVDPYEATNYDYHFDGGSIIELQRRVAGGGYITVDSIQVPFGAGDWMTEYGESRSIERDISRHKCIRRLWASAAGAGSPTLGSSNSYTDPDPNSRMIQAHPANEDFTNIGEIGKIFHEDAYGGIGQSDTEADVRIDLADTDYHSLFQYLTVFDPTNDGIDNDGDYLTDFADVIGPEWKIAGRININTAPWYVIAQLPWVSDELAQAMVAYRDRTSISGGPDYSGQPGAPGFGSVGELNNLVDGNPVYRIDYYALDSNDLDDFPDLTPADNAEDDFEERDVIFARISNLVTVRSDVFTAYILVRIGANGPQKRVMVILDRSDFYYGNGRVRIVALYPVPDPR